MDPVNLDDFETLAAERLSRMAYDYYRSGAFDEVTLADNRAAWQRVPLHYRVLAGVGERSTRTTVLGAAVDLPVLIAPTAFQGLAHPDAELATVRAAGAAGTVMVLATLSNTALEHVVAAASGPVWFQLYVYRDRGVTEALVRRAAAAGCSALVLTVDAAVLGRRDADVRNRFHLPDGLRAENLVADGFGALPPGAADSGLAAYVSSMLDPGLSWGDLDWLASVTDLPLVVKGVVRADDARRAVDHGCAGLVVSNHGGRQLDGAPATADVLPRIADEVGDRCEVLVDGGIRRGTDVVRALALGARAVLIGRPALWGLAVDGERGVGRVLEILRDELDQSLALCGVADVRDIDRTLVLPG